MPLTNKSQCFETVHAWHEDVENQEIERFRVEQIETATAVTGSSDIVAGSFEKEPQRHPNSIVVVNNNNSCQGRRSAGNCVNGRLNRYPSAAVVQEFCRFHRLGAKRYARWRADMAGAPALPRCVSR